MKNEALRIFLASAALLLTALLANPISDFSILGSDSSEPKIAAVMPQPPKPEKKPAPKISKSEPKKKARATRSFAFFFRRG